MLKSYGSYTEFVGFASLFGDAKVLPYPKERIVQEEPEDGDTDDVAVRGED